MADAFNFELVSPERLLLSEQVTSVVVPGTDGDFTVLSKHAPLMTTVKAGVVEATLASGGAQSAFSCAAVLPMFHRTGSPCWPKRRCRLKTSTRPPSPRRSRTPRKMSRTPKAMPGKHAAQAKLDQLNELKAALGH